VCLLRYCIANFEWFNMLALRRNHRRVLCLMLLDCCESSASFWRAQSGLVVMVILHTGCVDNGMV
jgi:hypothetical protein